MTEIGDAYHRAAELWSHGAEPVYARFAEALFTVSPISLHGARVLDVGAGTGVVAVAALARGAREAVALDLAPGMLRLAPPPVRPVVADATRLPFRDGSFNLVTAAFSLSHLRYPVAGLAEMRRVGATVLVAAFAPGPEHPAKAAVDAALAAYGFEPPWWHRELKDALGVRVDDPAGLAGLAQEAGFGEIAVTRIDVDAGLDTAEKLADWRLGMAHLAPFVAGLTPGGRAEARAAAVAATTGLPPLLTGILALRARCR
jgi:SAM-dependent methyltransferase